LRAAAKTEGVEVDEKLKQHLVTDYNQADISEKEKLMLAYAEKTTREAWTIDTNYIANLKARGFTDRMLHDIVQVTAYFNYVNRVADALGIELESQPG
jgi:uncharacterized peroxidase-related enzyme